MTGNYEFTPEQERHMARLAKTMRLTAIAFIVMAIVEELVAILKAYSVKQLNIEIEWGEFAYESIAALLYAFIGLSLWRVVSSFQLLATTEGHDIPHLMDAIKKLTFANRKQAILLFLLAIHSALYLYRLFKAYM
ncbi:MAG: hypothetical protein RMJ44_07545 [Cytophagales bacterium]|nr:hypothetical protein [Bernardetiaceae bacterium]MDW8210928.1 hypothetical protein [Cytophagales bacterium]